MSLTALDVAILPPPEVAARARAISEELMRARGSQEGLLLDDRHRPHITLAMLFVRDEELPIVFERVDEVLRAQPPLALSVTGSGRSGHSAWMTIEKTPPLVALHERLMEAVRGVERAGGTAHAFFEGDARVGDIAWVASYRLKSSFGAFTPHITIGTLPHGKTEGDLPPVDPQPFEATLVAACHLGRFCSCRAVLRDWELV
jgi:2'-5' RNA ligase